MSNDRYELEVLKAGFRRGEFTHEGESRVVYELGSGPPVLVLSELPGIMRSTVELGERLSAEGYSVCLPQLFGRPGADFSVARSVAVAARLCVSREFTMFAVGQESPIVGWLKGLARHLRDVHGARGVGVIGMCFTGGFALAMMADASVLAPVLSQPSLPAALLPGSTRDAGVSDATFELVRERCAREDLNVLGLRFSCDPLVPEARFGRLKQELGDRFIEVKLDSSLRNRHGFKPWAHSVLTKEYQGTEGHPTREAFEQVLALFDCQLRNGAT